MDLAIRKYNFIKELTIVDEVVLEKLEKVLMSSRKEDWFIELSTDEQSEIEIGLMEADKNEFINNEDVMRKFAKWHQK